MYLIRFANGEEAVFKTVQELGAGIRKGVVGPRASVYHRRSGDWLPVESHPHYQFARSLAAGEVPVASVPTTGPGGGAPSTPAEPVVPLAAARPAPPAPVPPVELPPSAPPRAARLEPAAAPPASEPVIVTRSTAPIAPAAALLIAAAPPPMRSVPGPPTSPAGSPVMMTEPIGPAVTSPRPAPPAPSQAPPPTQAPPAVRPTLFEDASANVRGAPEPLRIELLPLPPERTRTRPVRPREMNEVPGPSAAAPIAVSLPPRRLGGRSLSLAALVLCVGLLAGWRLRVTSGSGPVTASAPAALHDSGKGGRYLPAPAPSTLERGATVREAVSLAAEAPPIIPGAAEPDPLAPIPRGELVARYEMAYAASRRELAADLELAGFGNALSSSVLATPAGALRGRRIVAASVNVIGQYRRRETMIDQAYADTVTFQSRRAGWSAAELRAWNARASLRESYESAGIAESILADADSMLAILVAGRYRIAGDTVSFEAASAGAAWAALRTRLAAQAAEDPPAPERHPTYAAVRMLLATPLPRALE